MAQLVSQLILPITLAFIMLVMGLGLTKADFARVLRYPKAILLGLVLQLLLLPILALVVALVFELSATASAGLFLLSLCPGGATSNMFSALAKGDVALSISLTAVTSFIIPFSLPVTFAFYLAYLGQAEQAFALPLGVMIKQLVAVTLVPVLLGMWLRHLAFNTVNKITPVLTKLAGISMVTVICLLIATNYGTVVKAVSISGIAVLSLCLLGLLLGYLVATKAGLTLGSVKTIALEVGVQNAGTAMMVAYVILQQPQLALIPLMYGLLMNIPALLFVYWVNKPKLSIRPIV